MEEMVNEQQNDNDEELLQLQVNKSVAKKRIESLMTAVVLFIWGLIVNFSPIYLSITVDWINTIIQIIAIFIYICSFIKLVRTYKIPLEKIPFDIVVFIGYIITAVSLRLLLLLVPENNIDPTIAIVIKIAIILISLLAVESIIRYIFEFLYFRPEKRQEIIKTVTLKNILAVIFGAITAITTIIQFIQLISPLILFKH